LRAMSSALVLEDFRVYVWIEARGFLSAPLARLSDSSKFPFT